MKNILPCFYEDRKFKPGFLVEAIRLLNSLKSPQAIAAIRALNSLDQDYEIITTLRSIADMNREDDLRDLATSRAAQLESEDPLKITSSNRTEN